MNDFNWDGKKSTKNNFLAKIFGLIGEDITHIWINNPLCKYYNFGRPTIYWTEENNAKQATLDFLFKTKERVDGGFYLVEQKNLFAYDTGKLRTIKDSPDFYHSYDVWSRNKSKSTQAWDIFNNYRKQSYKIKIPNKSEIDNIEGTILIWSDVIETDKAKFLEKYNIYDVIGLTAMIKELIDSNDPAFKDYIQEKKMWLNELYLHF